MTGSDDRFVGRWSRLKQEARAPAPDDEPRTASLPVAEDSAAPAEEAPTIAAEDLPDIDSLDKDSDYTPFMQVGVPEQLKKLALRALWRSDPVLANLDGLNDYDDDYKLAHDVGAELMRKFREAEKKLSEDEPESEEELEQEDSDDPTDKKTMAEINDDPIDPDDGEIEEDPELG
jgi:hypothetical protein